MKQKQADQQTSFNINLDALVSNQKEYIEKIFKEENLASKQSLSMLGKNGSALASKKTKLVGCFYD